MIVKTALERQPLKNMPQRKANHHTQRIRRIRTTRQSHMVARSSFTYTSHTIANERHPDRNEDSLLVNTSTGLVAVFDGVGGSAAGEIASQTAAKATQQGWGGILKQHQKKHRAVALLEQCKSLDLCTILQNLILESDEQVRTNGAKLAGTDDLATTAALATFCTHPDTHSYTMVYAHVGDSRIYLLREQQPIKRLTNDDGLLAKLVENQMINECEALRIDQAMDAEQLSDTEFSYFRLRGGITQALGSPSPPTIHVNQIAIQPGDHILLSTDGIHDNLVDEEIEDILRNAPGTTAANALVERSLARSHEDRSVTIRAKPDDMSAVVAICRF